jgi:hypothetical protein
MPTQLLVVDLHLHVDRLTAQRLPDIWLDRPVRVLSHHVLNGAADQLVRNGAEPRRIQVVHELEPFLPIAVRQQNRCAVGDEAELTLAVADVLFCRQPRADVPVDLEYRFGNGIGPLQRPSALDGDASAILADMIQEPFPLAVAYQIAMDLVERRRRFNAQKLLDVAAGGFFCRPSVQALRTAVPEKNRAFDRSDDDGVVRELEESGQRCELGDVGGRKVVRLDSLRRHGGRHSIATSGLQRTFIAFIAYIPLP